MLDFDEILVSVKNPQIKKYIKESIKSYQVGNYRSAIISIWIAAMFDLVKKFEILVDQREPTAIVKWNALKPKIEAHQNWENELIGAAKTTDMINRYEADTLERLSKTRNRYAHPSFDDMGTLFDPTPEEVRYFIRTLYDIVLSQPAQLGAFYVNQLLESLKGPNLLSNLISADELPELKDDVIEKISRINSRQVPRLIKELFNALISPISKGHEINILCVLVNIWGSKSELHMPFEISIHWNDFILHQELDYSVLEAILDYPECINELSEIAQQMIGENFRSEIIQDIMHIKVPKSAIKFLAAADVVPLAKSLLSEASNLIPLSMLMRDNWHCKALFGNQFSTLFGDQILGETRKILITRDGYKVNPALSALRCCGIWDVTALLSEAEKKKFSSELILSLNSNNYETMSLLCFSNRADIPTQWVKLLIDQWLDNLRSKSWVKDSLTCYWGHYLGLLERYTENIGSYSDQTEVLQILISQINSSSRSLEIISELSSNVELWKFWRKVLMDNQKLIQSTPLEAMD